MFKLPPEFKGFSKLTTLDFEEVDYDPAIFRHFISQSPLLERIRIASCTELDPFEIEGSSLRVFTFHGLLKTICFKKSMLLAEVSLSIPYLSIQSFTGFKFQIPPMLEKLHLHSCLLEFSVGGDVPSRFADSLNSLEALHISMSMGSIKEVACAFCIARSSPNLQKLTITFDHDYRIAKAVREFTRAQETPDPYLHQLRRVELFYLYFDPVFELLRYLLPDSRKW